MSSEELEVEVSDEELAYAERLCQDKARKRLEGEECCRIFKRIVELETTHFVVAKSPGTFLKFIPKVCILQLVGMFPAIETIMLHVFSHVVSFLERGCPRAILHC